MPQNDLRDSPYPTSYVNAGVFSARSIHRNGPYSKRKVALSHVNLHGATISVNFTACLLIFMLGVKGWKESLLLYRGVQKAQHGRDGFIEKLVSRLKLLL